ncbi:RHS repeat-associated core domain-containing protein, partial [Chitinispirillales bacterium ANBcel5]|uniref:RHS repeat-associated core domain-containing protein n=1 Tax=Cellulosispirillum alkaliphilum TaxID=3039283 RepID=UPI002A54148E|nr:RHS repeat-associated core domain-containing protein [Chitinispirillales bacterium ANBcel5]
YCADVGRWVSTDPAREFWDLYNYNGGNPISWVDPNGMYRISYGDLPGERNVFVIHIADEIKHFNEGGRGKILDKVVKNFISPLFYYGIKVPLEFIGLMQPTVHGLNVSDERELEINKALFSEEDRKKSIITMRESELREWVSENKEKFGEDAVKSVDEIKDGLNRGFWDGMVNFLRSRYDE